MPHSDLVTHPAELDALLALVRAPDRVDRHFYKWSSETTSITLGAAAKPCYWVLRHPDGVTEGRDAIAALFTDPSFRECYSLGSPPAASKISADATALPCPFCGSSEVRVRYVHGRSCRTCGANAPTLVAWNRRTASALSAPPVPASAPSAPTATTLPAHPLPVALARLARPWEPVA